MLKNGKRVCAAGRQYYVLFAFQKQNFQICTKLKLHGIGIVHQNQGGVLAATAEYPSALTRSACLQIFATKTPYLTIANFCNINVVFTIASIGSPYFIFVIFSPQTVFLAKIFSTQKRVSRNKPILRQNSVNRKKTQILQ